MVLVPPPNSPRRAFTASMPRAAALFSPVPNMPASSRRAAHTAISDQLDGVDGRLARMLKGTSKFGAELDVIGDTIPRFGANMGELALPGVHKATAIERLLAEVGIDRADTIAFGDGTNDLEMLDYVAVGVAMGDSPAVVRDAADLVVPAASDEGLAIGFRRLGLT